LKSLSTPLAHAQGNRIAKHGLTSAQVAELRAKYGLNELEDEEVNPILQFLGYFWGPMPVMIWIAIIIELI